MAINIAPQCCDDDFSPLMHAAVTNDIAGARALIESGADVDAASDKNQTAVFFAAAFGHADILAMLIEAGANLEAKAGSGWTALLCAAQHQPDGVLRLLVDGGADLTARTDCGLTAAMVAGKHGRSKAVLDLLAASPSATVTPADTVAA